MKIEIDPKLQQQIREVFEPLTKRPLTDEEVFEAVFNLRGFSQVLLKMGKEVGFNVHSNSKFGRSKNSSRKSVQTKP